MDGPAPALRLPTIVATIAIWGVGSAGCAPEPIQPDPTSADPAARIAAYERIAVASEDRPLERDELEALVAGLRSQDQLVRVIAISALERATGTTMGYRSFDPEAVRAVSVQAWRDAIDEGRVPVRALAGTEPEAGA